MFFNIINYTLLFLAAPYMVSALVVNSNTKYAKNPSPAWQIPYGVCHDVSTKFGGYTTGTQFYSNVLKPGVWLGGTPFGGCSGNSMCGQCMEARNATHGLGVLFLIVDYECGFLTTAPGAVTALNALPGEVEGLAGRPLSYCYADCVPTPDLWGCQ
ncbi:hypothetical protein TWF718_000396 [Orbilia javanica]|uniref:Uncharacterized protein n=1 Tax=Orbilia javanica TaxID=47235 RepID=A0AAN8RM46_9PEZI